jgi:hypothetical protein
LEVGCGEGDLLASVKPSYGVGIDFSPEMVALARARHPDLSFIEADAHDFEISDSFDYIVLSDLVNDVWDVQRIISRVSHMATSDTRIVLNFYNRLWESPLRAAATFGFARRALLQNWLTESDVEGFLRLCGLEVVRNWTEIIALTNLAGLGRLANQYLARSWPVRKLALTNFVVARTVAPRSLPALPTVSVIVAARNEAGNIEALLERVPDMGAATDIVFVEGHSTDDTYETIARLIANEPLGRCQLFRQNGIGKGDAVRTGLSQAKGDILMILDADLTVPPEDLPRFYDALISGAGEFINGVRLVYPMETEAMRSLNLFGNRLFSLAFTWILDQPIRDTLCGTKVLWKSDYEKIAANREYFGDFDPFGDYDLLFGAAKLNLSIAEVPIRYRERVYGSTNISRWRHGWLLLRMVAFAARRIKFV